MSYYDENNNRPFNLTGDLPGNERLRKLHDKKRSMIRQSRYNFAGGEYAVPETGYNSYDTYNGDDEGRRWDGSRGGRTANHDFNTGGRYYSRNSYRSDNDFNDPKYYGERYADQHANEQAYRGLESSDRGRRNSEYSNPDFGSRADFEGNRYRDLRQPPRGRQQTTPDNFETYHKSKSMRYGYTDSLTGLDGDRGRFSHRGKGPKNYTRSDARIQEDAHMALTESHNVDATDIELSVANGILVLSGTVDSRYAKKNAESAVDYISGVRDVENRIHVRPDKAPSRYRGENEIKGQSGKSKDFNAKTGYLP